LLGIIRYMKPVTFIFAAIFLAVSPVLVYYSRYYIQEIILVFFTYVALFSIFRWLHAGSRKWAILTGIAFGMMFVTKETWIIAVGGMIMAILLIFFSLKKNETFFNGRIQLVKGIAWMMFFTILIGILFYSSFFSNLQGLADSVGAYAGYFNKAGGFEAHLQPWHYYLHLLVTGGKGNGFWTEIFLLMTGSIGAVISVRNRHDGEGRFFFFVASFSIFTGIIYSVIPYKTPWNLLTFYTGWILLAGYGCASLLQLAGTGKIKYLVLAILFSGIIHLGYQAIRLNFEYDADPGNPWAYGHTDQDIFRIVERLEKIAGAQPAAREIPVEIIVENHDYWPLPWYLRKFTHTGWWDHVDRDNPSAPVIIASPAFENALLEKIYELPPPGQRFLYLPLFDTIPALRPGVYLKGYIRKDVWDFLRE
jgi:uncharacterized protein (TIGR03663 family)